MAAKNIAAILGHKFNYSLPSLSFRAPYERVAVAVAHRNFTSSALSSIFNGQSPPRLHDRRRMVGDADDPATARFRSRRCLSLKRTDTKIRLRADQKPQKMIPQ
jgi:hypothetical protein